jgi:hypothetical protein
MTAKKQVLIDVDALNFYVSEANEIHALMDAGGVPRTFNGEKVSMAQRVRWFYETRETFNAAIQKAQRGNTTH